MAIPNVNRIRYVCVRCGAGGANSFHPASCHACGHDTMVAEASIRDSALLALYECTGCGWRCIDPATDLAAIRARPHGISCCPDRDMKLVKYCPGQVGAVRDAKKSPGSIRGFLLCAVGQYPVTSMITHGCPSMLAWFCTTLTTLLAIFTETHADTHMYSRPDGSVSV